MDSSKIEILRDNAKANMYTPHGNVTDADCVIGFSFGYRETKLGIEPGISNYQIASYIENNLRDLPLILQFEINNALVKRKSELVIRESRQKGEYLHSREIAEQAYIFMNQKGWKSAVIVTHQAMEARNDALCAKLGITTIAPEGLIIDYDPESVQPWTRNQDAWWQREDKVIAKCIEKGWL